MTGRGEMRDAARASRPASSDAHAAACSPLDGCALCGDVAIRVRVLATDAATGTARAEALEEADTGGADGRAEATDLRPRLTVALDLVDGVRVGDVLLVHQGFAIERVTEP